MSSIVETEKVSNEEEEADKMKVDDHADMSTSVADTTRSSVVEQTLQKQDKKGKKNKSGGGGEDLNLSKSRDSFLRLWHGYNSARCVDSSELGRYYLRATQKISTHAVLRMDPQIKRVICKGCFVLLRPGTTARFRMHGRHGDGRARITVTCLECGKFQKLPINFNQRSNVEHCFSKTEDSKRKWRQRQASRRKRRRRRGGQGVNRKEKA